MRGRAFRRVLRVAVLQLAAVSLLAQGPSVPPARGASAQVQISYRAYASPTSIELCPGEVKEFKVQIYRRTVVNGRSHPMPIAGGTIAGLIQDGNIGHFDPPGETKPVGAYPQAEAQFTFVADKIGRTDIHFAIRATGEEQRVGGQWRTAHDTVKVNVIGCWEAYTSGLATVFSRKYIGNFRYPFSLEGRIASQGLEGATQHMFFIPNPQNPHTGGYAFIDSFWPLAAPGVRCTAYVAGRFDVVFYPDEEHAVEGDLLMRGSGVLVCPKSVAPIDYRNSTGFQIAFKPFDSTP